VFGERPGLGFVVQEGPRPPAADSVRIPGTPLLLTRGEPVRIRVHNRLTTPLAVHWHGIELESYADGVGGWSGSGRRVAPMIAPGGSFVARMTPPRAGTFMYHVHNEHGDELASGLYAPLLVLEPGRVFDPATDRVFVIATGGPGAGRGEDAPPFINGTAAPDTLTLVAGTTYRFRLIDIAANEAHVISLRGPGGPATWRALARDGRDLPPEQATSQPSREVMASGVTRDFEFTATAAGEYALSVATVVASKPTGYVTTVPVRVRAP
jgi:FtsP/CotA-like multicopper oxidase with cupredoxin domain